MKNNLKIVLMFILVILIGSGIAFGFYLMDKRGKADEVVNNEKNNNKTESVILEKQTDATKTTSEKVAISEKATSVSSEIVNRLQSYPYYQKSAKIGFKQLIESNPELAKWISDTLFTYIVEFESNEKFLTNEKLTYVSWNDNYVVRGVYQIKEKDGSVKEQDVEFEYRTGNLEGANRQLYFVGERILNNSKVVKGD